MIISLFTGDARKPTLCIVKTEVASYSVVICTFYTISIVFIVCIFIVHVIWLLLGVGKLYNLRA